IDFIEYKLEPHTIFFVTPGQVHFWDLTVPLEGTFIMFEPEFLHLHHPNPNFMYQFDYFHRTDTVPLLNVNDNRRVQTYQQIVSNMHDEFVEERLGYETVLSGLLQVLLTEAQRDYICVEPMTDFQNSFIISNQ